MLVIMQSEKSKSPNVLGLSPNAGTKTSRSTACAVFYHYKHYKQFIFVWPWTFGLTFLWLACVSFLCFPTPLRLWYFRQGPQLFFLATSPPCVFQHVPCHLRRFVQSLALCFLVVLHWCVVSTWVNVFSAANWSWEQQKISEQSATPSSCTCSLLS